MLKANSAQELENILRQRLRTRGWAILDCKVTNHEVHQDIDSIPVEVLNFAELLLSQVLEELGTPEDVLCVVDKNHFVLVSADANAIEIKDLSKRRFATEATKHYRLAIGIASNNDFFQKVS